MKIVSNEAGVLATVESEELIVYTQRKV